MVRRVLCAPQTVVPAVTVSLVAPACNATPDSAQTVFAATHLFVTANAEAAMWKDPRVPVRSPPVPLPVVSLGVRGQRTSRQVFAMEQALVSRLRPCLVIPTTVMAMSVEHRAPPTVAVRRTQPATMVPA